MEESKFEQDQDPFIRYNNINTTEILDDEEENDANILSGYLRITNPHRIKPTLVDGKYTGEYKDGKFHGKGIFVDSDLNTYDGFFKNGFLHGKATILYHSSGMKYSGFVKYDLYDGFGKISYTKKSSYEGDFREGYKEGLGIEKFENGDKYEGEFFDDSFEGYGVMVYKNDPKYEKKDGNWSGGKFRGEGKITYTDGSFYDGHVIDSIPNSVGTFYGINKKIKFKGEFRNGVYNGKGFLHDDEGNKKFFGYFKNGLYQGYGEEFENDVISYYGYYRKGKRHGVGKLKLNKEFIKKNYIDGNEVENYQNDILKSVKNDLCGICMEKFEDDVDNGNNVVNLDCKHYFHHKCLEKWIFKKPTCPICRSGVDFIDDSRNKRKHNVFNEFEYDDEDADY